MIFRWQYSHKLSAIVVAEAHDWYDVARSFVYPVLSYVRKVDVNATGDPGQ